MKTAPKIVRLSLALGVLALSVVACDLGKLTNQATASAVAVATVLSTPEIELRGEAVAGFDASVPDFDGGLVFDGGLPFDAGVTVPPQNLVTLYFGNKGPSLDTAPTGVPGATVTLTEVGGASYPLEDLGGGNYGLGDAGFAYKSNATYDFTIVHNNTTYVAEVERVPAQERIAEFHPAAGYVELTAGQAFSFTRPEPPSNQEPALGFVTVFPVSSSGGKGEPTYTNIPSTPLQFLKLVVAPTDWKKPVVEIPGTAFPNADSNYVIILQSAKLGGPKSDNLFTGSAILAGTADVAIVKTRP